MRQRKSCAIVVLFGIAAVLPLSSQAATFTTLFSFDGTTGASPFDGVTYYNGVLYGAAAGGGSTGGGTLISFDLKDRIEKTLLNFGGARQGNYPNAAVIVGGILFGTTQTGGVELGGAAYEFDIASGKLKIIKEFGSTLTQRDGPTGLTQFKTDLFGTTRSGTIFHINEKTGNEVTLATIAPADQTVQPNSGLVVAGNAVYGTTELGGANLSGSIFKLDLKTRVITTLYSFMGYPDGLQPKAGLLYAQGMLWGTTSACVFSCLGTVFKVDPASGIETTVYSFTGGQDGGAPTTRLVSHHGLLYGFTYQGGTSNSGTIFGIDPKTEAESTVYSFTGGASGSGPFGIISAAGALYGTMSMGGSGGYGTIFEFVP